jgi:thymidine phosphorylase
MLVAQGADLDAFNQKLDLDHTAPIVLDLKATATGFVCRCDARVLGEVIRDLGAGRLTKESAINYDVGIDQLAKPGDQVQPASTLARIHAPNSTQAIDACERLKGAFEISEKPPIAEKLIREVIQ